MMLWPGYEVLTQPPTARQAVSTLIVLRHGKSDWSGDEPDHRRPLAARGRRQVPEAGRWLADNVGVIDLAVVSPAARTRETWRLAAAQLEQPPPVREDDRVYAGSGHSLLGVVRELPAEVATVVLVGHNRGVEDLVASLVGRWVPMPTSSLAVIALSGPWSAAGSAAAELQARGRPPEDVIRRGRHDDQNV
jgi:phosphohistidine phosphatase